MATKQTERQSSEAPFSVTFKAMNPHGFEYLVTVRPQAENAEEFFAELTNIDQLTEELANNGYKPVVFQQRSGGFGGGNKSNTQTAAQADGPACNCGVPRVFKSGTSKAGKAWKGYACVNKRCEMQWQNG